MIARDRLERLGTTNWEGKNQRVVCGEAFIETTKGDGDEHKEWNCRAFGAKRRVCVHAYEL